MECDGVGFPERVEECQVNKLEVAMEVYFVDCPFGQHVECAQEKIAQPCAQTERKHIPCSKNYIKLQWNLDMPFPCQWGNCLIPWRKSPLALSISFLSLRSYAQIFGICHWLRRRACLLLWGHLLFWTSGSERNCILGLASSSIPSVLRQLWWSIFRSLLY